jgi:hypothetical protein
VTLLQGSAALESPGQRGEWLADSVEVAWRTADARGEALFDLEPAPVDVGEWRAGARLWLQATSSDERAPQGRASTHGLCIERP